MLAWLLMPLLLLLASLCKCCRIDAARQAVLCWRRACFQQVGSRRYVYAAAVAVEGAGTA